MSTIDTVLLYNHCVTPPPNLFALCEFTYYLLFFVVIVIVVVGGQTACTLQNVCDFDLLEDGSILSLEPTNKRHHTRTFHFRDFSPFALKQILDIQCRHPLGHPNKSAVRLVARKNQMLL